jgi:hypothetical protein
LYNSKKKLTIVIKENPNISNPFVTVIELE